MDLYEYLKNDHRTVSKLFAKVESTTSLEEKKEILTNLCDELELHLATEEESFYKTLKKIPELKDIVSHGANEHTEIQNFILEFRNNKDQIHGDFIKKFKKEVEHHVEEEEGKIHPAAKKHLTEEQAENIKNRMNSLKQKKEEEKEAA